MSYNGELAAKYAIKYAMNPSPTFPYYASEAGGDCTNFVSQCFSYGGCPQATNTSPWYYNQKTHAHSNSWIIADILYHMLISKGKKTSPGIKGEELDSPFELKLGDAIFYENNENRIYHSAIVTDFDESNNSSIPLISQHTYDQANVIYFKPNALKSHFVRIYL
ncbi:MAG TPA: amidase domain-containing protein [Clostridiaceae bacterium]